MAGLGGLGFFLGGLGTSFQKSYNASAELRLEQERMQMAERRQQVADMEKKRSEWWDFIQEHIKAVGDANPNISDADLIKSLGAFPEDVRKVEQRMGYPAEMATTRLADMLARRRAMMMSQNGLAGALGGGGVQGAQGQQGAPGPVPFVNMDDQGQGQPSGAGTIQPTSSIQQPEELQQSAAQLQKLAEVINNAKKLGPGHEGTIEVAKGAIKEILSKHHGGSKNLITIHDNGRTYLYDKDTKKAEEVQLPEPELPGGPAKQSMYVDNGTLPPANDTAMKALATKGVSMDQFDFQAQMVAFGNTDILKGYRGSGKGADLRQLLNARATDFWRAKGLGPKEANETIVEFQNMKKGAGTLAVLDARMTSALTKAEATAPVLLGISSKISRTDYMLLNEYILKGKKWTGDPDVPKFKVALETLASNYGSTLGMGNSVLTDYQTKRAQSLLEDGYSQGQLEATVQQMMVEIKREKSALRSSMRTFMGQSDDETETQTQDIKDMTTDELHQRLQELESGR